VAKKNLFLKAQKRDYPPHKYQLETLMNSFKAANYYLDMYHWYAV